MVFSQVVIEKFANYFEVELRRSPVSRGGFVMDARDAVDRCDERTIGVVAILGSTYTGHFDDVSRLNSLLQRRNEEKG